MKVRFLVSVDAVGEDVEADGEDAGDDEDLGPGGELGAGGSGGLGERQSLWVSSGLSRSTRVRGAGMSEPTAAT